MPTVLECRARARTLDFGSHLPEQAPGYSKRSVLTSLSIVLRQTSSSLARSSGVPRYDTIDRPAISA